MLHVVIKGRDGYNSSQGGNSARKKEYSRKYAAISVKYDIDLPNADAEEGNATKAFGLVP